MHAFSPLTALDQIELDQQLLLTIQREQLLPLLEQQTQLSRYAEPLVQQQAALLHPIQAQLTQQLGQTIQELIQHLSASKKSLKKRKFNALQKWLGIDLEFDAGQIKYMKNLDQLIDQADHLSKRLDLEIQHAQNRQQQLIGLRVQMAHYVAAAQGFLQDYPQFVKQSDPLDHFPERLSKKINSLITLQSSHDMAMMQMRLSQQLAVGLIDRFKEAQQVLIPAWRFHVKQTHEQKSSQNFDELDQSRDQLIRTLKRTLEK